MSFFSARLRFGIGGGPKGWFWLDFLCLPVIV